MNYCDLSVTQKRIVDAMVAVMPELANRDSVTRPEVEFCWNIINNNRVPGAKYIGYPSFITKGDKLARGVYKFPGPNLTIDDEFYQELSDWGIELEAYKER